MKTRNMMLAIAVLLSSQAMASEWWEPTGEFKKLSMSDKRCQNALDQTPSSLRRSARCCYLQTEQYIDQKTKKVKKTRQVAHVGPNCPGGNASLFR